MGKTVDRNKIGLLIASFFLAVGLFYYITGEESVEIEKVVYLKIIPPQGMTIIGGPRREVNVKLAAPRNALSMLSSRRLIAEHKVSDAAKVGKYSFSLRGRDINLPQPGIRLVGLDPELITIALDAVISKKLIVKPYIVGNPSEGYVIDKDAILTDPNEALVKGPKGKLGEKKYILTEAIDVVGRIRSFRITVPLKYSSQYSVLSKETTDVYIPIKPKGELQSFENVPINILHAASADHSVSIEPKYVTIQLKGPPRSLQKLDKSSIVVFVDITELGRGEYQLPVKMSLPSDVSIEGDVPIIKVMIAEKMKPLQVGPPSVTTAVSPPVAPRSSEKQQTAENGV